MRPGPERDGIGTWRTRDLCRLVEARFGVANAKNGMPAVPQFGLPWQRARPIHPATDPSFQARFAKIDLIAPIARDQRASSASSSGSSTRLASARPAASVVSGSRRYAPRATRANYAMSGLSVRRRLTMSASALVLPTVCAAAIAAMLAELSQAMARRPRRRS
jgi:hypothetical protein